MVEAGYNYTPAAKSLTAAANESEVDELTRKIERLSLNYTTLASALTSQSASNNNDNQQEKGKEIINQEIFTTTTVQTEQQK